MMNSEASKADKTLNIVVPVFNEEDVLPEFFKRIHSVIPQLGVKASVLYIDDGSTDRTAELLNKECAAHPNTRVIHFSRNFGAQAVHRAGLSEAVGDAMVFIDSDLQDPPELMLEMIKKWKDGADIVICQRRSRAETGLRGFWFRMFHSIYSKMIGGLIPPDSGIFGLISRPALEALRACPETNLFVPGLRGWVGFRQEIITYDREERKAGETKQSFWKLLQYAWNAIASFSTLPLRMILILGCIISSVTTLYAGVLIIIRLVQFFGFFEGLKTPGFTTLAVAIFFLGGIQLMSLGIIGEYLARIYDECKRRPSYIVKKRVP
jgi:polyisoprenyl-phosphate glycosyltransferase